MNPLTGLLGLIGLEPIRAAIGAVGPNRYAPRLGAQQSIAAAQVAYGIRPGFQGGSGSEVDWIATQGAGPAVAQDLTAGAIPPSTFVPLMPPPIEWGPLLRTGESWGENQRAPAPRLLPWTLLPPTARTPKPRDVQRAYNVGHLGDLRLQDGFEGF